MINRIEYRYYKNLKSDQVCNYIGLVIYILLFIWMITDFICFNKIFSGIISIIWFMYIIYHIKEYYRIKKNLSIYSKEEIKEYKLKHENILQSK